MSNSEQNSLLQKKNSEFDSPSSQQKEDDEEGAEEGANQLDSEAEGKVSIYIQMNAPLRHYKCYYMLCKILLYLKNIHINLLIERSNKFYHGIWALFNIKMDLSGHVACTLCAENWSCCARE